VPEIRLEEDHARGMDGLEQALVVIGEHRRRLEPEGKVMSVPRE
jgi:hypothetical protein